MANRDVVIAVRLTPAEYQRLYEMAGRYTMPVSIMARAIVLGKLTPDGEPVANGRKS